MYCIAYSADKCVYGNSKEVKNYIEDKIEVKWRLRFFPKKKLLLDVVGNIKEEEGKTVIQLED